MGRFSDMKGKGGNSRRGKYIEHYFDPVTKTRTTTQWCVRIDKVREIRTRKSGDGIAVEMTVLTSTHPNFKLGDPASVLILYRHDIWSDLFADFIVAATGLASSEEVDEAGCEAVISSANPLGGVIVGVEARHHQTLTAKRDISAFEWTPAGVLEAKMAELAKSVAPAQQDLGEDAAA